jgi:hypothetical protein
MVSLTLPLFVAGVFADDAHDVLSLDDFAGFTKPFDRSSYFHKWTISPLVGCGCIPTRIIQRRHGAIRSVV